MKALITWWKRRKIDRAQALIEGYGLSVVKLQTVAGTMYLINADGSAMRLVATSKGKK